MIVESIITIILAVLAIALSFLSIDIIAIAGIYTALSYGVLYGVFLVVASKLISGGLRKKIDHRTLIHIIGVIIVISIGSLLPFSYLWWYPMALFLCYIMITFPVIQYMGGDFFKGMLYNAKDILTAIIFLWLIGRIF